jgi:hypothetical protein
MALDSAFIVLTAMVLIALDFFNAQFFFKIFVYSRLILLIFVYKRINSLKIKLP